MDGTRLAIIGPGRLGRTVARLGVGAGVDVVVAGRGSATRTLRTIEAFVTGVETSTVADAVHGADVVLLAIPLTEVLELEGESLERDSLHGRIVIDAANYWDTTDGVRPDLEDPSTPTSVLVQRALPGALVVKALNHVGYDDLAFLARGDAAGGDAAGGDAAGRDAAGRVAIGIAGDDDGAVRLVAALVEAIGFDALVVGGLADSAVLEPRSPVFGLAADRETLRARIALLRDEPPRDD